MVGRGNGFPRAYDSGPDWMRRSGAMSIGSKKVVNILPAAIAARYSSTCPIFSKSASIVTSHLAGVSYVYRLLARSLDIA